MARSFFSIILIGGASLYFAELGSESVLQSVVLPLIVFLSVVALCFWLVAFFHRRGVKQTGYSSGDGVGGSFDGDSGGC